jgi:hypothetical protein
VAHGLKQHTLRESAGATHRLIQRELYDVHTKLPMRRSLSRRRRQARSEPIKLVQKGGTALSYAVVDSRSSQSFAEPEKYAGFWLCDPREKRIGMVEKLFVNVSGEPEYIRVRMGFFGFKSVVLPVQNVGVDKQRRILLLQ